MYFLITTAKVPLRKVINPKLLRWSCLVANGSDCGFTGQLPRCECVEQHAAWSSCKETLALGHPGCKKSHCEKVSKLNTLKNWWSWLCPDSHNYTFYCNLWTSHWRAEYRDRDMKLVYNTWIFQSGCSHWKYFESCKHFKSTFSALKPILFLCLFVYFLRRESLMWFDFWSLWH